MIFRHDSIFKGPVNGWAQDVSIHKYLSLGLSHTVSQIIGDYQWNFEAVYFPVSSATTRGNCLHIFYYSRPSLTVCFNYIQYFDLSTHKGDHTQSLCMIIRSIRESARFPRYICIQFCQVSSFIKPDVVLPRASLRAGNCMDINQFGSIIRFGTQFLQ